MKRFLTTFRRSARYPILALTAALLAFAALGSASAAVAPLSSAEIAGLRYMREEEKLARDIYVYQRLLAGSENHLRAFAGTLERTTGVANTPQRLDQAGYAAIIGGSNSQGRTGSAGRGRGPRR